MIKNKFRNPKLRDGRPGFIFPRLFLPPSWVVFDHRNQLFAINLEPEESINLEPDESIGFGVALHY
jgi:hypothetical protein